MVQPGYPMYPPPKPPVSGADIAISATVLILTAVFGAAAAFFGIFSLAFLDHCPPATCSVDGAVTAVMTSLGIAFVIGVVGLVVTVVQLFRRKRGWPFAVATLLLCVGTVFLGGVGYVMAVGG
ncbi:hypothetical protein BST36_10285 [Mycolicibacterium moriokaense]|jgi:hypothetical protein|uniref:Uncharacterized protein n=1 Tax=Mycolicibacterium moriokaense TaxID=39691 RepID=A0AAD1M688_9MYCO|nr:hypothetical protein [Mycolicibacterium moriokaense]MCV7038385.1 hypothetical protein [Mycolicibacterium moriokaense]ORB24937.1 hypothetical protein BST36_10285 [Mycolicibacterium moriokaense]BBX02492.1 hypothetical protein MMOR_34280 [Mycolicibacterium moriokaense]